MSDQIDIIEQLQDKDDFTDVEQQAVSYILAHPEEVSVMNISDLSRAAYTSNGTIIRICRKMGMNGFRDLKHALTREIEAKKHIHGNIDFNTPFGTHQSIPEIIQSMAELYRQSTEITLHSLDWHDIRDAAEIMHHSDHIVLYAFGDSMITAEMFANRLVKIGIYCIIASLFGDQRYVNDGLDHEDCALFISYSGENMMVMDNIESLQKNHVPMISITGNKNSSIASAADVAITIPAKEGTTEEKISTFYSQISFSMILNILYSLLYAMKQ